MLGTFVTSKSVQEQERPSQNQELEDQNVEVFMSPNVDSDTLQQSSPATENEITLDLNVYQEGGETLDSSDHGIGEIPNKKELSVMVAEAKSATRLDISKDIHRPPNQPIRKKAVKSIKKKKNIRKSSYPCPRCDYVGSSAKLLKSHRNRTCLAKPIPCPLCNKIYKNKGTMKKHMKYIHSEIQYQTCEICDKTFTYYSYVQHLKIHKEGHGKTSFVCEICSETFTSKHKYDNHKTSMHLEHGNQNTAPVEGKRDGRKSSVSSLKRTFRPRTYKCLLESSSADSDSEFHKDSGDESTWSLSSHTSLSDQDTDCNSVISLGGTDNDSLTKRTRNVEMSSALDYVDKHNCEEPNQDSLNQQSASDDMIVAREDNDKNSKYDLLSDQDIDSEHAESQTVQSTCIDDVGGTCSGERELTLDSMDLSNKDQVYVKTEASDDTSDIVENRRSNGNKMKKLHKKRLLNNMFEKKFVRDTKLRRNKSADVEMSVYACPNCDYIGKSKQNLSSHLKRICLAKPMPCPICNKVYKNKSQVKKHIKYLHDTDNPYRSCKICDKVYSYGSYVQHMKIHKEGYNKPCFMCEFCSRTFTTKIRYQYHINSIHLGHVYPKLLCSYCGKSFKSDSGLREHLIRHTDERLHTCETCGKSFKYFKSLRYHKLYYHDNHYKEQKVKCEICDKAIKHPKQLYSHMKTHTHKKEFNFSCNQCGKQFEFKHSLTRHLRTHDGSQTDYCKLCNKTFNDVSIVRRHIILVHKSDKTQWKVHAGKLETDL